MTLSSSQNHSASSRLITTLSYSSSSSIALLIHSSFSITSCSFYHGILSRTLLWRCSSQSFATSHGLLGSSPTLCPLASRRPLTCIYTAGHPTLQSASAIAGIITPPVFLHFDSMTPCSSSHCRLLRYLMRRLRYSGLLPVGRLPLALTAIDCSLMETCCPPAVDPITWICC